MEEHVPVRGGGTGPQATNKGVVIGALLEEEGGAQLQSWWVLHVEEEIGDEQGGEDHQQREHVLDKGGQHLALGVAGSLH